MIKLDISHLSWQLNKSFNISRGSKNTAETIEVKLTENKFTGIGFTYDDVLLVPSYSEFLPNQVDLTTKFSKNINLNISIIIK